MVIGDLTEMGYDSQWCVVSASDCGAPHQRDRFWLVAHAKGERRWQGGKQSHVSGKDGRPDRQMRSVACGASEQPENLADTDSAQREGNQCSKRGTAERANTSQPSWWASEPDVGRVADGVAARVDRLKAIGNGQVPIVAATAWRILNGA
jgi:DNA (cytosine-5)-methyltransferase 1